MTPLEIFLPEVALLVECPTCAACSIEGDEVEPCWELDGSAAVAFVHDERFEHARALLERASELLE